MSENAIMAANAKNITFKSEALNAVTAEINGYINEVQTTAQHNHIAISKALARVASEKLYEEDGFKSALEYAMNTFGWKRANAYAMMQVGAKLNANELPEGNFSVSQYREMLTMSKDELEEAIESGVISEEMSAKDIREEVAIIKPKKERKSKPEDVYVWYLDAVPCRGDIIATESALRGANNCDGSQRVAFKIGDDSIVGYLVANNGQIRYYVKGEKAPVADAEGETVAETEG